MDASEILPGATEYLQSIRARGIKTALGSASRNAPLILERLGISALFDSIVDGNKVTNVKPDPEVFLRAAQELQVPPAQCVVFEDAAAGIEAARRAGMGTVGIGSTRTLKEADVVVPGLFELVVISAQ
jgi:beta-phosphoglucomutase